MANLLSTILSGNNHVTFGPNSTWSSYLRVGGNGRSVDGNTYASVVTTNGNLHIDAGNAMGTYINFYAGTAGIAFGNGASGVVAWMGPDGDLWKGGGDNSGTQYVYNSGTWGISITGNANTATSAGSATSASTAGFSDEAKWISYPDGPRDLSDRSPNWNNRSVAWDFVGAGTANGSGNYGGVMTFVPWDGTSASTGDSSYQLAFANTTGVNASGQPKLSIRNGINSAWNAWYTLIHSGNIGSQSVASADNSTNLGGLSSARYPKQDYYADASYNWDTIAAANSESAIVLRIESGVLNPPANDVYNWSLWQQGSLSRGSQIAVAAYGAAKMFFRGSNFDSGSYGPWNEIITSANIGSQSVSNATTAGGLAVHAGRNNEANKIVRTQENGYVFFGYINSTSGNENNNSNADRVWGTNGSDDYLRTYRTSALSVGYAASAGNSSTTSQIVFSDLKINFPSGAGGGHSFGANHYSMGLDVGNGGWDSPHYRDVIIGYHTGIRIGGSYSGVRFYNNSPTTDANNDGNGDGGEALLMTVGGYVGTANGTDVVVNNNLFANVSMRAPIFYDSADTGYYLDPNGTSNLVNLTTSTRARWNMPRTWYDRSARTSDQGYWTGTNGWGLQDGTWATAWKGGFSGWDIWGEGAADHPQSSQGYVHAQGIVSGQHAATADGSSAYGWMMVGAHNATANRYWLRGKWDTTTSAWVEMITTGNIGSQSVTYATSAGSAGSAGTAGSAGSVDGLTINNSGAPINPDNVTQNQIGYNTSVSLFGQTDGGLYSSAYSSSWIHQIYGDFRSGQIAIRGKNSGTWGDWRLVVDDRNVGTYAVPYGDMTSSTGLNDNKLYLRTNGDNNHYLWNAADDWEELVYFNGTGFRVKGATGTVPAYFTEAGVYASAYRGKDNVGGTGTASWHPDGIYSGGTQWLYGTTYRNNASTSGQGQMYFDGNYGYGMVGLYDSTRYQAIFAMGDSYKLPVNGTTTGSLYGLAWSHPNAGGVAGNLNTHGLLVMENGTFLAAISGSIRSRDDMRAPIFYDSNDTTYYLDPNATTSLKIAGLIETTRSSGTMLSHGSMADAIGWNGDYGTYIGSTVGGTSYLYANGTFYTGGAFRTLIHSGNIASQSVDYATNSTRLYASDSPYTYGGAAPYYMSMTYDGSRWLLKVTPGTPADVRVSYADSAGNADTVDSLHASVFVRNDTYNSADAGLQVFRNIGTIDGSWPSSDHTFGLENSDAGNIVVNFHRSGYTSNNLWYNGSQFRFDTVVSSTSDFRAPIFYDSANTAYYGDFAGISSMYGLAIRGDQNSTSGENQIFFWSNGNTTTSAIGFKAVAGVWAEHGYTSAGYNTYFTMDSANRGWVFRRATVGGSEWTGVNVASISNTGNAQFDGYVNTPAGYVSNGNPWSTANSAFFPNGITTAGGTNWIYGTTTFIGNAPGNGAGHDFSSSGHQYSTGSITTPLFLVNNHSDNTRGYRIYNTSSSSVSAMFVNSSNQLVIAAGAVDQINLNKKVLVNAVALGVNVAPSATAGRIDASNDIVAFSSSDERLKNNITPIENALDKVKSLTGVEFDWKPEHKEAHGHEGHDTGIIAQQVLGVMPSAVRTNDTGYLAVRYEKLIGLLIEANKELAARVEELEKKLG
jgi:hypothetical protein